MMNVATMLKTHVTTTATSLALEDRAAFDQAERLMPLVDVPGGPGGEHAGEDGAQRAADAVDAEGVERHRRSRSVPLILLQANAADDAGGRAHERAPASG